MTKKPAKKMAKKAKTKSADTGLYTTSIGADPKTTYNPDEYPTRMLRKLVRLIDKDYYPDDVEDLILRIKKHMGWK